MGKTTQGSAIIPSQDETRWSYEIHMVQIINSGTKTNREIIKLGADPGEIGFKRHNIQAETFVHLVEEVLDFSDGTFNHSMCIMRCNCTC